MPDNRTLQELTPKQKKMIAIILEAPSISEGCRKARVSRQWFYESMKDDTFRAEFIRQRQAVVDEALHALKTATGEAINVLRELLKAEGESVRLKTAQTIVENVLKSVEIERLEKRVEELERNIKG